MWYLDIFGRAWKLWGIQPPQLWPSPGVSSSSLGRLVMAAAKFGPKGTDGSAKKIWRKWSCEGCCGFCCFGLFRRVPIQQICPCSRCSSELPGEIIYIVPLTHFNQWVKDDDSNCPQCGIWLQLSLVLTMADALLAANKTLQKAPTIINMVSSATDHTQFTIDFPLAGYL